MPLTEEEVKRMGLGPKNVDIDVEVGDDVQILNGPLETFTGKVVAINRSAQKVTVNVSMFGRATDVEVEFFQVKKINVQNAQ
jgi:transcriptional antiterminator NusG